MASNPTPDSIGEDLCDGLTRHAVASSIKHNPFAAVRADLDVLIAVQNAFKATEGAQPDAYNTLRSADSNAKGFIARAIQVLSISLGNVWSDAWSAIGLLDNTVGVPRTQDARFAALGGLNAYFPANPAKENAPLNVTAAIAGTLYQALCCARTAVGNALALTKNKDKARDAAKVTFRERYRATIGELEQLLSDDDAKWYDFGLSRRSDPAQPSQPSNFHASQLGSGRVLVQLGGAQRANSFNYYRKLTATDAERVKVINTEGTQHTIQGLPAGATVEITATGANDAGEGQVSEPVSVVAKKRIQYPGAPSIILSTRPMNTSRTFLIVLLSTCIAGAQENPAPVSVPATAQSEMQKWIATTDAQWQAAYQRDVADVRGAETKKLMLHYLNMLEDAIGKASKANDLTGALALRAEQKRFGDTQIFPEQDEAADTAEVKQVRTAIRALLAQAEANSAVRAKALHAKYDQVLAQAQGQLTERQRLDDALLVKAKRDEVAAAWLAGIPAPPSAAVVEQPKTPTTIPVKPASSRMGQSAGVGSPTSVVPDSPEAREATITKKLVGTKWAFPAKSGNNWIRFQKDGVLFIGWANSTFGKWKISGDRTVQVSAFTDSSLVSTYEFNVSFQSATVVSHQGIPHKNVQRQR
jgi:hypothetical protein